MSINISADATGSLTVTVAPHPESRAELYKVSIINGTQTCKIEATTSPLNCTLTGLDKAGHEYTLGARGCAGSGPSEVCSSWTLGRMSKLSAGMSCVQTNSISCDGSDQL